MHLIHREEYHSSSLNHELVNLLIRIGLGDASEPPVKQLNARQKQATMETLTNCIPLPVQLSTAPEQIDFISVHRGHVESATWALNLSAP